MDAEVDPAVGDRGRADDLAARLEAPLRRAGDGVERVEALAAAHVDVAVRDEDRLDGEGRDSVAMRQRSRPSVASRA